ncbi:MCP methyltransferase, partial [Burkholderia cepacia]|nr:MCP methyltransferase [Burkholderia cepacia]
AAAAPYRRAERFTVAPLAATRSVLAVAPPARLDDTRQPFAAPPPATHAAALDARGDLPATAAESAEAAGSLAPVAERP